MSSPPLAIVHIVDDDDAVRDSLRSLLECNGFTVQEYASAPEFLAADQPSRRGCLLLDLHMPGMTGVELLAHLQKARSPLSVIAMTGRSDPELKKKVAQLGAFTLLQKPMNDDVLIWTIETALPSVQLRQKDV